MDINGWKYYNHAAISMCAPHEIPDLTPINNKTIWKIKGGKPLLVRWTTEFDCKEETQWWYVIKDKPFDISTLKAKRRYEINKGLKNYDVSIINPLVYKEELFNVQVAAFSAYPEKYRPTVNKDSFIKNIEGWSKYSVFGVFSKDTEELCGYALLTQNSDSYLGLNVLKTNPIHEKNAVNAALVAGILYHYDAFLRNGGYICDGERSISHETAFQDYLEKYFEFKKVYCHLNIKYNPKVSWLIKIIYPFRKLLLKFDFKKIVHNINSVLKMEEIIRSQK